MRIHTAVFRPWKPHYAWFGRDSGLVTEGLNSIGVESRLVILDTPGMPQDERFFPASREDFCSSDFWRGLRLDAVVLQGGEGANEPVSAAIRESGTRLLLRLDSDGVMAPQVDPWLFTYGLWWWLAYHKKHPALFRALGTTAAKILFPGKFGPGRLVRRFAVPDALLVESPVAASRLRRLMSGQGRSDIAEKIFHVPIPVPQLPRDQIPPAREKIILSVGRWDDAQKDAPKLIRVMGNVLARHPDYRAVIIGDGDDFVRSLVKKYAPTFDDRIQVIGRSTPEEIAAQERKARIFLCTSRGESMHIASAEAVCRGCSAVGPAQIPAMQEYAGFQSGTLSWTRRTNDLADAVSAEIAAWEAGRRDPEAIGSHFAFQFSPETIARQIVNIVGELPPGI